MALIFIIPCYNYQYSLYLTCYVIYLFNEILYLHKIISFFVSTSSNKFELSKQRLWFRGYQVNQCLLLYHMSKIWLSDKVNTDNKTWNDSTYCIFELFIYWWPLICYNWAVNPWKFNNTVNNYDSMATPIAAMNIVI